MRLGIIHLSDFHIKGNERFSNVKIQKLIESTNVLGDIDQFAIVFSGDLAFSGEKKQYESARYIFGKLIQGLKDKTNNCFVNVFKVPGNHDLRLIQESRTGTDIQNYYNDNVIDAKIQEELNLLDEYYENSNDIVNGNNRLVNVKTISYGKHRIQFNLINTALFSTLKPDDKELHYLSSSAISRISKKKDADICISVMHHSYEWFQWKCKNDLEKTLIDNSELIFVGHDHYGISKTIALDDGKTTWFSCAGEMRFGEEGFEDSFNAIVLDLDKYVFDGYRFDWNSRGKIYIHKHIQKNIALERKGEILQPLPSYIKEIKDDEFCSSRDFMDYYVFPKLISEKKNEYGRNKEIKDFEELWSSIQDKSSVIISGPTNSGKTMLLKYIYCSLIGKRVPLLLLIDSTTSINPKSFVSRLFAEQYGENTILKEKFDQTKKNNRVLIIDGWETLKDGKKKEKLLEVIKENFGLILFSNNSVSKDVKESIKEELLDDATYAEYKIKPFYTEKRNELVRNICALKTSYKDEDISRINKLIDSLVLNNSSLFSLHPGFIVKYTDFFINSKSIDYTKGEATFGKVFEFELQKSIIEHSKKNDVDEFFTSFEEIAGYMFESKKDIISIDEYKKVIESYNIEYGVVVNANTLLEVGKRSKVLKVTGDLSIYYGSKNYLAYFIAKYLIRKSQEVVPNTSGIEYALKNICFGINSDIVMFISYILNNSKMVMAIAEKAGELLAPWNELDLDNFNIGFIKKQEDRSVKAPTEEDHSKADRIREDVEEQKYSDNNVEAVGLFSYDEDLIDQEPYRLIRAVIYTEMICKALPAFNNTLKLEQKQKLIDMIYSYPHRIIYARLQNIEMNYDEICDDIKEFIRIFDIKKKNGDSITDEDIHNKIALFGNMLVLSYYDHFAELCTSHKTIDNLIKNDYSCFTKELERLIIIENSGDSELFLVEAEKMLNSKKDPYARFLIKNIARKHLLCNRSLPFDKKQRINDKLLGESYRKELLASM